MTPHEALVQGYKYYFYVGEEFQSTKPLGNLLDPNHEDWERELDLAEKEPYHPACMEAKDILELLAEQIECSHKDECGDDSDDVSEAVNSIDVSAVQPLIDAITEKLSDLNYYRLADIGIEKE